MRIVVIGATGGTGRLVVGEGAARGHEVVALARRPDADIPHGERIRIAPGDVRNPESLAAALEGADAVVSCLGVGGLFAAKKVGDLLSAGARNLLAAMQQRGVRRLVAVSSVGVDDDPTEEWIYRHVLKPFFLKPLYDDMAEMERIIEASATDWTLLRPPLLIDKPARGRFRLHRGGNVPGARRLTRADLANFILDILASGDYPRERVGICN